ncbi:DNA-processing protein DprA [Pseudoxanthomonas daejeonensis]|uniref:DNA-processing protein DprA n=1 Tax=Pseudoxanthomonas daejeonensis TaxID=266062 RepID=UPI001F547B26|nr:DNA-processing protein DprA [Pseudoxanthomonas daejeonensis]UNK58494.1 DNA-processing protein DprA [Pseudoxanthomonas daejeonensis]
MPAPCPPDPLALLRRLLAGERRAPHRALPPPGGPGDPELRAGKEAIPAAALDRALAWLAHPGHHLIGNDDPRYPPLLRQAPDPPLALFVDGDPDMLWRPSIAVVGSRSASQGGRDTARLFADALCRAGLAVTSGLAAGIDAAAHEAALATGGLTVAVLGTGADVPYPPRHDRLRDRIAISGAVVSEHLPGTPPRAWHFPGRNRIIAGLSLGTLVVEAAVRSGALITARLAAEAGREVFAIPGSIHLPQARGCHRLIRDGAQLVEHPDEVLAGIAALAGRLATSLGPHARSTDAPTTRSARPSCAPRGDTVDHDRLWAALGYDPTPMDLLVERTGLTTAALSSMLLAMELDGRVAVEHGRYARRSTGGDAIA